VIVGLGILALQRENYQSQYAMLGGLVLAGNPGGAVLQWLVQVPAWRSGMGTATSTWGAGSDEVMGPATFSSGMTHINLIILILASYIPPSRCRFDYAGLLVQTPLGIISNVILVPMLPIFSG